MLAGATLILFVSSAIEQRGTVLVEWVSAKNAVIRYSLYWGCLVFIIFSMDIGGQEFIGF
jgi:hypothetical protein